MRTIFIALLGLGGLGLAGCEYEERRDDGVFQEDEGVFQEDENVGEELRDQEAFDGDEEIVE